MKLKSKILVTALTVVLVVVGGLATTALIYTDYKLYLAESECVRKHMKYKVERKDITTENGRCYVNTD